MKKRQRYYDLDADENVVPFVPGKGMRNPYEEQLLIVETEAAPGVSVRTLFDGQIEDGNDPTFFWTDVSTDYGLEVVRGYKDIKEARRGHTQTVFEERHKIFQASAKAGILGFVPDAAEDGHIMFGSDDTGPFYVLDTHRNTVEVADTDAVKAFYRTPPSNWLVGIDLVGEAIVRTIFVGNKSNGASKPRFFVTTLIRDGRTLWMWELLYSTWEEALHGHLFVVEWFNEAVRPSD